MSGVDGFPKRVKTLRRLKGLTQVGLAQELELPQGVISRWERGVFLPNLHNVVRLAQTLGVSVDYLVVGR